MVCFCVAVLYHYVAKLRIYSIRKQILSVKYFWFVIRLKRYTTVLYVRIMALNSVSMRKGKLTQEFGIFFAWGEVNASKESYDWGSYYWMAQGKADWMHINKYQIADSINYGKQGDWWGNGQFLGDGIECLESSDDAATANWGSC